mmetsp:Transcript_17515/g.38843  ORF Transcript_17515/g.38843 Transcript_17515/m.38843 type:complete len:217 (+) Transcript_17515:397-1047(+)
MVGALGGACVEHLGGVVQSALVRGLRRLGVRKARVGVGEAQLLGLVEVVAISTGHVTQRPQLLVLDARPVHQHHQRRQLSPKPALCRHGVLHYGDQLAELGPRYLTPHGVLRRQLHELVHDEIWCVHAHAVVDDLSDVLGGYGVELSAGERRPSLRLVEHIVKGRLQALRSRPLQHDASHVLLVHEIRLTASRAEHLRVVGQLYLELHRAFVGLAQ